MKKTRHILSIILVFTMLLSGLPTFIPEDVSRDRKVDLQDAVLWVMDFVSTAEKPVSFESKMEKVISTLHILVGMKENFRPPKDAKNLGTDHMFLAIRPAHLLNAYLPVNIIQNDGYKKFQTIDPEPLTPPPRSFC